MATQMKMGHLLSGREVWVQAERMYEATLELAQKLQTNASMIILSLTGTKLFAHTASLPLMERSKGTWGVLCKMRHATDDLKKTSTGHFTTFHPHFSTHYQSIVI